MSRLISAVCLLVSFAVFPNLARAAEDIVIADFEGVDVGDWTVTGDAFGKGPATAQQATATLHQRQG